MLGVSEEGRLLTFLERPNETRRDEVRGVRKYGSRVEM